MLKLKELRKSYQTFDFTQTALDGVSVSFRDSEFAAILGPSGSGKTTMLNIIGGLDHYDSGDLEIDGISTKKYKDSDWDTYRNNRIGFVFQSYNLISHQSVLANVELALTLSGVSSAERKKRAYQALEEVGLREHARKLPNQLSGGQMQRVALARALINDPEILLADEPTGALDSKTSEQVMDLLKEIAKDRLVVMVTHNPELADEYATRIIQLQDGQLVSDSNPFQPNKDELREGRAPRKVSMSFFTAIFLSLSNLMTKKGRTFVTSLAGSIGIVGIAAILALANGINAYIEDIEQETMSIYPLTVQSSGLDLTALLSSMSGLPDPATDSDGSSEEDVVDVIKERKIVESLFESQNENDLQALKAYIEENNSKIEPHVKNIQYTYDITPQIYLADTFNSIEQVNPDGLLQSYGIGGGMGMNLLGGSGGMNVFYEMPGEISMFDYQYDIKAGRWPTSHDEAVLVLAPDSGITDFILYSLGVRDRANLSDMLDVLITNPDAELTLHEENLSITYDMILDAELKIVNPADRYEYDEDFGVWLNRANQDAFMADLIKDGMPLKIVGIVQGSADATATSLPVGINYMPELITHLMQEAKEKPIVKSQLSNPSVNVLSGKTFAEEKEEGADSDFNFADLITVDEDALQNAFQFDESKLNLDLSGLDSNLSMDMSSLGSGLSMDMSDLGAGLSMDMSTLENMQMPVFSMDELTAQIASEVNIPADALTAIIQNVVGGFLVETASDGPMPAEDFVDAFYAYLARPDVQVSINSQVNALLDQSQMSAQVENIVQDYITGLLGSFIHQLTEQMTQVQAQMQSQIQSQLQTVMGEVEKQIQTQLTSAMGSLPGQIKKEMESALSGLPSQLEEALNVDPDALTSAFQVDFDESEILELMNALMNQTENTSESILTRLGYANPDSPSQISFYPLNFRSKEEVENFLEAYNTQMEENGDENKVISYTDIVGIMMSSVTDIVDTISYALIAFVAISLVVSSIMIGVITYISVLERKKEIGILRAIGASKRDVRRVFNAETMIIGFVAGGLGIAITVLISAIANVIVYNQLGIKNIAQLPITNAIVLIAISMLLAFLSGLFPSSAAARKDPVEALRSE